LQTDGNTATTVVPGANYSSDVITTCEDRMVTLDVVWSEDFSLTIEFGAVSITIFCEQLTHVEMLRME